MKNFLSMRRDERISSLALGKFDGMHLAHRELFRHLDKNGAVFCIESGGELLSPNKERYSPFEMIGVDFSEIEEWSGEYFVRRLREKFAGLKKLVVGYDFCFGKNRAWHASDLAKLFGGEVIIVSEFCVRGQGVHSSVIKALILSGDMEGASAMLGRYYRLYGRIIHGQNLGSKQLYATINLACKGYVLPQDGVYASFTKLDGRIYKSVCFIGRRLSTDGCFSIETHIIDENLQGHGSEASVCFVRKIRNNESFSDLAELKKRIASDIALACEILDGAEAALVDC